MRAPVRLAADYGASLYLSNGGVDAGLLAGVPLMEGEVYGAVRGFGHLYWVAVSPNLSAALTLGVNTILEGTEGSFELTLATGGYNGVGPREGVRLVGFSLVPALGFTF